ncbi:MAG TPA: hypothetical protein VFZ25_07680, partial [Chloroflexota bacterium]|nr:hypothetical protein [Chloroflexota bacterium]
AVFLNSHLLSEVELVCDRVAVVHRGKVVALGRLSELLGETSSVRLRVSGLRLADQPDLAHWGTLEDDGEWQTVRGIAAERIPDLVAAIVRKGGRVYAVEPRQQTLEDRFLQLLQDPSADPSSTGPRLVESATPTGVGGVA